ncbi:helix-turn-helix domain-containing protein [Acidianus sp. RZ1]|uniref:helix-turn-helix domain-containing protein n=1 Tax=Acidianus sp. RZ1 TaxID=1540082 RepID=UPI001490AEC6|nr:helix-turn-helix domain-containing protein [Acidianus sp. RZ1]NON61173.1 MarR family transcriptional regulator [Acidianus sp. RZ1]
MEVVFDLKNKKESIKCCYKISETDVDCLFKLAEMGRAVTSTELASEMNFSKTTVESSLKKLIELGLVQRIKIDEKKIGRPKFLYAVESTVWDKVSKDLKDCANKILSAIS